jgi:diaminopimelate epimerase
MRYYNADGSLGTMCGNGARCLARFAQMAGIEADEMYFDSDAGRLRALVPADPEAAVRIYFGPPQHFERGVPLQGPSREAVEAPYAIWTGTEHLVCFVPAVDAVPVEVLGPGLRADAALLPAGANVNFVEVVRVGGEEGVARLRVRTYEKGVEGETLACGTGAMASVLVARLVGSIDVNEAEVEMQGGTLKVGFGFDGEEITGVYLEGPAEVIYRGSVEVG